VLAGDGGDDEDEITLRQDVLHACRLDTVFLKDRLRQPGVEYPDARLLAGSEIGIVGFGDLGKALRRVLSGFRARIRVFDPWLPQSILEENGV
ncbi:NAD(P)-dependent oxidoreductase, partial [Rhizobium leguminosarum]|uniref:NAD(P)-dependent oxidoreductase n=1 Tax=Rhizobium leguminosarum TaxID=384 RepID=UPI003F9C19FB